MNRKQRACVVAGFFLLVLSLLFAPTHPYRSPLVRYSFLFTGQGSIDFARLFAEWLLIALVTGGIFYTVRGPNSPKPETGIQKAKTTTESTWRHLLSLSVVLFVVVAALGTTSYGLFRKVRRLEAGIQNLNAIVGELPPPGTPYLAALTPQEVLQADSQYHYTSDLWAAWVVAERQHLNACVGHIRRVREELSKLD